jgi:hypothetical protein
MTPYSAVRLGVWYNLAERLNYGTCAYERNRAAPLIVDALAAYNSLFGLVGTPGEMTEFTQRGRMLAWANDAANHALSTFSGNSVERAKLESYLQAIEEVSARQGTLMNNSATIAAAKPTDPSTNPFYAHNSSTDNDPLARFAGMMELATAALKGELTNVVVVGSGTGGQFDMLYPSAAENNGVMRHPLHHGSLTDPSYVRTIHDVTGQQIKAIARMALALKNTPDPANGGNMLDTTCIVYISDNGEAHHAVGVEFPILLLGGNGMGLRLGGQTVAYPGYGVSGNRQVSNLWNTLGHLTGAAKVDLSPTTHVNFDLFGGEGLSRIAPGPLSELMA